MRQGVVTAGVVLLVSLGSASAWAQAESQPTPPYAPSADDLACAADADCITTCSFGPYSCCPSHCSPCTFVLNREALARRQAECVAEEPDCPTVGACAELPSEQGLGRCLEGACAVEIVAVEATEPPAP